MKRKNWEQPNLLVLVRNAPKDGIMQVVICKFQDLVGPTFNGPLNCRMPAPGGLVDCQGIQAS